MTRHHEEYDRRKERERAEHDAAKAFFGEGYNRKPKVPSTGKKPTCAMCGKRYGSRAEECETTVYLIGQPVEPYRGNGIVTLEWLSVGRGMGPGGEPGARLWRYVWDGETYRSKSDPFCSQRCATRFAQGAYKAGWRIKGLE